MKKFVKGLNDESFSRMMSGSLILSLLMLGVGVLFYFAPALINDLIGYILAGLCIVSSLNTLYKFFKREGAKLYSLNLIFSILLLVLGIIVLLRPSIVTSFITVCTGMYLMLIGSLKVSYGLWLKYGSEKSWALTTLVGIMIVAFGIILFINPFDSSREITEILGIFIVLGNILDIVDILLIKKRSSEIVKVFW